jgi:hypothetical protein
MTDASPRCSDVGNLRVCWEAPEPTDGIVVTARSVPRVALSRLGFRCTGSGARRVCVDRARGTEEFRCAGDRCEERHPRRPDAGEWECVDVAGAVFCRGGEPPAGAPPGAPDAGFICAARVVKGTPARERVCVDWSPDFPDGIGTGYRCRFEEASVGQAGAVRVCEKDAAAHLVGDTCDRAHPCIGGLSCAAARCVPPQPTPSCWVDGDCDQRVCRFGTCTAASP